jgi:hypothetical protein
MEEKKASRDHAPAACAVTSGQSREAGRKTTQTPQLESR